MPERLSKSQIDKLGERLRTSDEVSVEDLTVLQRVRSEHDAAMAVVADRLTAELGLEPGSRLKTVGTIVDKLRREHIRLSQMQDIAGVRVVQAMGLDEQDAMVGAICGLFDGAKVVDRRERPTHGYRAVHVIVLSDGRNVEIQVRTELQHLWAQVFERLADWLGRGIRYGHSSARTTPLPDTWQRVSEATAEIEELDRKVAKYPDEIELVSRQSELKAKMTRFMHSALADLDMG